MKAVAKIVRRSPNQALFDSLSNDFSDIVKRVLSSRDINNVAEVSYGLQGLLHFESLHGIAECQKLLADTLEQGRSILIIGDYDTDGATATALSVLALRQMGAKVEYYSTKRLEEGYGLSVALAKKMCAELKFDLALTVDLGISEVEGIDFLREQEIDVIVTDHHLPGEELPKANVIVNPNLPNCDFPSKKLAGVGVAFYVMGALSRELSNRGWFTKQNLEPPKMAYFTDLVALGTIADVMELDFNNRILVSKGLELIRRGLCRQAITQMLLRLNIKRENIDCQDLSFQIIPRLNSAGRIGDMSLGVKWLLSSNQAEVVKLGKSLQELNQKRKLIEGRAVTEAEEILQEHGIDGFGIALCGEWHQGIIGILAGKIKEKYHCPTIIFSNDDGLLKGSGRSVKGGNLRQVLAEIDKECPNLLLSYGGHELAVGLSIKKEKFYQFRTKFYERLAEGPKKMEYRIETDGMLEAQDFNLETVRQFRRFPWGNAFPAPTFDGIYNIISLRSFSSHLSFKVRVSDRKHVECIAFNVANKQNFLVDSKVHIVYHIRENNYAGSSKLQLIIQHLEMVKEAY